VIFGRQIFGRQYKQESRSRQEPVWQETHLASKEWWTKERTEE